MSRTIRRKNAKFGYSYNSYVRLEDKFLYETDPYRMNREEYAKWAGVSPSKDIGKALLKKHYHSDSYSPMNNPSWYVNEFYTRPIRAKNRAQLREAVKLVNLDDLNDVEVTPSKYLPWYW